MDANGLADWGLSLRATGSRAALLSIHDLRAGASQELTCHGNAVLFWNLPVIVADSLSRS